MSENRPAFSVVIPCFNEAAAVAPTLQQLVALLDAGGSYEIVVVDDGSDDGSREVIDGLAADNARIRAVHHSRNQGYGAALKSGIRQADGELIVITDADGTYPNDRIPELVATARARRLDMLVGARIGPDVTYSRLRAIPKRFLKAWVSFLVNRDVPDMNSGLRVFRKDVVERFLNVLPDTFSFTTTITIVMMRNRFAVDYVPISYQQRIGRSKIKPIRDTLRFMQLILRTGMYFGPLRVLTPVILALAVVFVGSLVYDVVAIRNLTDKTVLLLLFTMNTAIFALLADMIDKRSG